jgi:hypothetical protein
MSGIGPEGKPREERESPSRARIRQTAIRNTAPQSRTPIWRIRKEDPGCLLATACITLYGTLLSITFVSMLAEKGDIVTKAEAFVSEPVREVLLSPVFSRV